ncbi:2Fe-2S iron-sulfur cluster-binding protein [Alphaproteobacteria bacterium]|nr:2Fe-2S iron-sulfur cluster-binding protein [Alphaproteobacteria bacterium]
MTELNNQNSPFVHFHQRINFQFDGKKYYGYKGDTIASALLRHGIKIIGRSFKYHRPRGIYTCGIEEPNALVQIISEHSEPNVRATIKKIYEGMEVESQNRWPSLEFDIGSINSILSPLFSAGFYYKTFMGPHKSFWKKIYEPVIRKAAGLGKPPKEFKAISSHLHHNVDIVIVGGGLNGLLAASSLIDTDYDILLIESDNQLGGILNNSSKINEINGLQPQEWVKEIVENIKKSKNIKILHNTLVTTYNYVNHLIAVEDKYVGTKPAEDKVNSTLHKIRTEHVILSNGHIERFLSFQNNDLPGIMLGASFEKFVCRYGVVPSKEPVIFSNNSNSNSLIQTLLELNIKPKAYIDSRSGEQIEGELFELIRKNDIPLYTNSQVKAAYGNKKLEKIVVQDSSGGINEISSDFLCVSGGINPDVHLFTQSKGLLDWDEKDLTYKPSKPFQNTITLGSASGQFNLEEIENELNQKLKIFNSNKIKIKIKSNTTSRYHIQKLWEVPAHKTSMWSKSFIDLQNDVTTKDIRQAISEGFDRIEHLKRFTTNSMGTDQGKISSINALGIVSELLDKKVNEVGTTIYRPPYAPLSFAAIAGRNSYEFYDPERKSPIHQWHMKNGAVFEDVVQWKRPWYFPLSKSETMHDAVQRESKTVRESAGILDGSTLGKIEIKGKDTLQFMNLIYTNSFTKMKSGSARYALMLGEDGMIKDDGIISKISDEHFIATTTTGGAANVLACMEEYAQTEWPNLNVYMNSITEQFATFNISGPKTRDIMTKVFPEIDFSNQAFPFMTFQFHEFQNTQLRIIRASFTGEMGYEVYVPSNFALKIWEQIQEAGKEFGLTPYGTETMHLLRAEKGYIIVGQDTDGSITPIDLGLNWMIGKTKTDFLGKRSLTRSDTVRPDRKQFVGILPLNKEDSLEEGQHIFFNDSIQTPVPMLGHITSSYHSPIMGHTFGLAVLKDGRNLIGTKAFASTSNQKTIPVKIVKPIFYDEKNERLVS